MSSPGAYDVDLRSLIDVLGTNLYSNPGVYVRELVQNALDAHTVAGTADTEIAIETDGVEFRIDDHGCGMSRSVIADLLGTIGRSSKRDDLGFAAEDTIGQFGVGLLSAFLVADAIDVDSRTPGGQPVGWSGSVAGRFTVADGTRAEPGTTIRLRARRGSEKWLHPHRVRRLVTDYIGLRRTPVRVNGETITPVADPFGADLNAGERAARRIAFCQDEFGFTPLETFELSVPQAGLRGVAYVRPSASDPTQRAGHRCYVKGLLVGDLADLLPDWAYFVRVVIDAQGLALTASREGLVRDELFAEVRDGLAAQVSDWLVRLGDHTSARERFLAVHELGIKSIAHRTPELLRFVDRHCRYETNVGPMSLSAFRARFGTLRYTSSVDDFRVLADILTHRGVGLINAGHAFETAVIRELLHANPDVSCEPVTQQYLLGQIGVAGTDDADTFAVLLDAARRALLRFDCRAEIGAFAPESVAALLITDDSAQLDRDREQLLANVEGKADAWLSALAGLVTDTEPVDGRPTLVLNTTNPLIQRLNGIHDELVRGAVLRTIYGQAAIRTRRPVSGVVAAEVDEALGILADLAARSVDVVNSPSPQSDS
ncbi:HSP90 family protein [Gordonia sp. NB41Y]|uniref:HSP90 family protein n=1 Tax=Gordonia sp. NB41Y TaxID=875808 RepID=UPI0006B1DA10|nr:HSP90 family protein [Gordonia sp. NB41Y]EMP12433.2 molecular chaperone Hsp90 [Gordonia sp. NB41Y]WLP88857.1 HSP90 family protein [Gordonia sp. NB41Y]